MITMETAVGQPFNYLRNESELFYQQSKENDVVLHMKKMFGVPHI